MDKEVTGYLEYLANFCEISKPQMPKFNLDAYSDSEYLDAINLVMEDYKYVDDFDVTISHLKGK